MTTRAAVVIGVANTGGLPLLRAAVSGAHAVAGWLAGDGYDVVCLTDEAGPVRVSRVKDEVGRLVGLGTVRQLVVYFAGHGYLNAYAETWLLSQAPEDPDEAVDQPLSIELARSCSIPSVTFVSDCCRSSPGSIQAARVGGSAIFPNRTDRGQDVEVDRLFATRPGDPALELPAQDAAGSYFGLFTSVWQAMHRDPALPLRREAMLGGVDVQVVSTRALKGVLPARVDAEAQDRSIKLTQVPEFRLEGGDDAFVARASFTVPPDLVVADALGQPSSSPSMADLLEPIHPDAAPALEGAIGQRRTAARPRPDFVGSSAFPRAVTAAMSDRAISERIDRLMAADVVTGPSTPVTVSGGTVVEAAFLAAGTGPFRWVATGPASAGGDAWADVPGSLFLQLSGGIGAVVAVLPGYSVAVTVDKGRIVNVGYVHQSEVAGHADRSRLRAVAAVAARDGLLASDKAEASGFGDFVAAMSPFDPTLSLYAALALAEMGLGRQAAAIRDVARHALGIDLSDLALLAGGSGAEAVTAGVLPTVPPCPMLGGSWSFMRAKGVASLPFPGDLTQHRVPALWTTLALDGATFPRSAG